MRSKKDPYTMMLPFDQVDAGLKESNRNLILKRLGRFLHSGRALPRRSLLITLMPALNRSDVGEPLARFTELEVAEILAELGAEIKPNPFHIKDACFRVSIPLQLQSCALQTYLGSM